MITISDVEAQGGEYTTITVSASELEFFAPQRYAELVKVIDRFTYERKLFFLACEYIESLDGICSTDHAKLEVWG